MQGRTYYSFKARNFLQEYDLSALTLDGLTKIIESQGYKIIRYNTFEEVSSTEALLNELGLKQYSAINSAFTYRDGNVKIVFIDDSLLDYDKFYALAHEEGHIYCGHMDRYTCSSTSVEDEHEANEFAHYIMNPSISFKLSRTIKHNSKRIIIVCLLLLIVIAGPLVYYNESKNYSKILDYYITDSGTKYHTEDCIYIQGNANVRKITEEEYSSGKYSPCKICNPLD